MEGSDTKKLLNVVRHYLKHNHNIALSRKMDGCKRHSRIAYTNKSDEN